MKTKLSQIGCKYVLGIIAIVFATVFIEASPTIVGGRDADIEEIPWQIYLGGCGGSILSETWILTAKHCVDDGSATVRAGITNRRSQNVRIDSKNVFFGPKRSDIALIELESPLEFNEKIQPIAYATPDDRAAGLIDPGVMGITSGWGDLEEDGDAPEILQLVEVPIMSNEWVNRREAYNGGVDDSEMAAGYDEGKKDNCFGDSGGPLVVPNASGEGYLLVGVVSWGDGCARPNLPGIYVRVAYYAGWIEEITGIPGGGAMGNILSVRTRGSGIVTSPSGINCGDDCREQFEDSTTTVTLTATASPGWTFKEWQGACTGTGICQVTVNSLQIVKAIFENPNFIGTVTLVDADNNRDIQELQTANQITLDGLPNITIEAVPVEAVGSMSFEVSGPQTFEHTENVVPYCLFGDASGNYSPWEPFPEEGTYTISITAYEGSNGSGEVLGSRTVSVTLVNGPVSISHDGPAGFSHALRLRQGQLWFALPRGGIYTISLHSLTGEKLRCTTGNYTEGRHSLSLGNFNEGMYLFQIQSGGRITHRKPILLQE